MNILVTGSTGFIGSQLCRALVTQGHSVRAFHRPTSSLRGLEGLPVEHALGDMTQPATLPAAMEGIEIVFHAAAMLSDMGDPAKMYAITVEGTRAVLQAAQQAGVRRLIHTSSVAALGVPETGPRMQGVPVLMDESHTWNYSPDGWRYGFAKYLAELEVQKAVAQGLDAVIVNPAVVFGAGDVYRISNSTVVQVARGQIPVAVQGGCNVVHIADVVAGHLAALERGRCGERYILGGQNMTFLTLINLIAGVTGARPVRSVLPAWLTRALGLPMRWLHPFIDLPVDARLLSMTGLFFYYDTQKSHAELGLELPRPPDQAIREAWDWFRNQPSSPLYTGANQPGQGPGTG